MRIAPPGRKSNSQTGLVNPRGPHHCATCFGSVHTLNTSSRGASNSRVNTNSCSSFVMMLPVAMLFLLFLHFVQILIQPIEALRPEPLVACDPIRNILEPPGRNPAGPPLRLAPACYHPSMFQHFEVAGDGGLGHGTEGSHVCPRSFSYGRRR